MDNDVLTDEDDVPRLFLDFDDPKPEKEKHTKKDEKPKVLKSVTAPPGVTAPPNSVPATPAIAQAPSEPPPILSNGDDNSRKKPKPQRMAKSYSARKSSPPPKFVHESLETPLILQPPENSHFGTARRRIRTQPDRFVNWLSQYQSRRQSAWPSFPASTAMPSMVPAAAPALPPHQHMSLQSNPTMDEDYFSVHPRRFLDDTFVSPTLRPLDDDDETFVLPRRHSDPLGTKKSKHEKKKDGKEQSDDKMKEVEKPKGLLGLFNEISPAVYISIISVSFIIAHQREAIEIYLHEGLIVMLSCLNYVTLVFSVLGGVLLFIRILVSKRLGLFNTAKPVADDRAKDKEKEKEEDREKNRRDQFYDPYRWEEPMLEGYAPERMYQSFPEPGMTADLSRTLSKRSLAHEYGEPMQFRSNKARSYSNPAVVPTPVYPSWGPQMDIGYEEAAGPPSPMNPYQHSHFGSMNGYQQAGMPMGGPQSQYLPGPAYEPPTLHSPADPGYLVPDPQYYDQASQPAYHQNPAPQPVLPILPTYDTLREYEERPSPRQSFELPLHIPSPHFYEPPIVEIQAKEKRNTFSNPMRILFKRREPEQEAAPKKQNPLSPPPEPPYVDDFACKPYGPPPRRYRGINV